VHGDNFYSGFDEAESGNSNLANTDQVALQKKKSKQFNNRTKDSQPYGHDEVRFTTKDDVLYVFVLNPKEGEIELPALGLNSVQNPKQIQSVKLIGVDEKIEFKQTNDKLILNVPAQRPNEYSAVFEVKGAL
jgi:alpha-L-fucosidase